MNYLTQKVTIEFTVEEWYDIAEAIYCYAAEMKYQYGEYLKKGKAKEPLGNFVLRTEALAEKIDKDLVSILLERISKQANGGKK